MVSKQTLGKYIVDCRMRLGITGAELARRAGLSRSFVCELEHDQRQISARTAWALADALKVNIMSLILRCKP